MGPLFPWFFSSFLPPPPSRYRYTAQTVDLITAQKDDRESEKHMQSAQKKKKKETKGKERGTSKKEKRKKSQRLSVRYSIGSINGVNTKLRYIPVPVERIW